jgi:sugar phosphate isomerase/epimerase
VEFPLTDFKVGLSMLYSLGEPFEKMVEKVSQQCVKYIELVDDGEHALDKKRVAELKDVSSAYGLEFAVHAPFAGMNIALESDPLLKVMLKRLKESIVNAADLECKMWIFHPGLRSAISMFYPGKDWMRNLESCRLLLRFARGHGLKIGIENIMGSFVLKNVADFQRFYDELDEELGLVLDTGHANLYGEVDGFLRAFPDRIAHVHAHDNFAQTDQHLGIGYGNINWKNFGELLKKTNFSGIVIVESIEHIEESVRKMKDLLQ